MRLSDAVAVHAGAAPVLRIMRGADEVWSAGLDGTVRVPVFAATAGMLAPTVIVTYTVTPTELSASAAVHTPTVSTDLAALLPVGFMASATLRPPAVSVAASVTAAPFAAAAGMPTPTVTSGLIIQPTPITAAAQLRTPSVSVGAGVAPAALTASAAFRTPIVASGLIVAPAPLTASAALRTPAISVGYGATPAPMTATAALQTPTAGMGVNVPVALRMTATAQSITPASIAATTTITGGAPFGASAQLLAPAVSISGGTIDLTAPIMTATAAALAPTVSLSAPTPWTNRVVIATPRNGTTTHTVDPSSATGVVSGTPFTPTAGRRLVVVCEGSVTSTTPTGWTLPTNGAAVNNTGLYVWHRVAAGADTFSTTHNGSNYPVAFAIYEFASTVNFVSCVQSSGAAYSAANPNLTGLTGTNVTFGVVAVGNESDVDPFTGSVAWGATGSPVEDVDLFVRREGTPVTGGYLFSIAINQANAATSFQPTGTVTNTSGVPNKECLTFAVK